MPALIGRHEDFLFITGLGGTACDVGAVTGDGAHVYSLGGAMGAACMMGLGLALARPDKRVLVVTGDGELLMNIGALATIARDEPGEPRDPVRRQRPLRRDRLAEEPHQPGHRPGEDGDRRRHQAHATVAAEADIADGARLLREGNGTCFVVVAGGPTEPPSSSATSMPRSAATASAPRCSG